MWYKTNFYPGEEIGLLKMALWCKNKTKHGNDNGNNLSLEAVLYTLFKICLIRLHQIYKCLLDAVS